MKGDVEARATWLEAYQKALEERPDEEGWVGKTQLFENYSKGSMPVAYRHFTEQGGEEFFDTKKVGKNRVKYRWAIGETEEDDAEEDRAPVDTFDAPGNEEAADAQAAEEEDEEGTAKSEAEAEAQANDEAENEKGQEEAETEDDAKNRASKEEEAPKKLTLSKEEVMKGIKDLEQMMGGLDSGSDE